MDNVRSSIIHYSDDKNELGKFIDKALRLQLKNGDIPSGTEISYYYMKELYEKHKHGEIITYDIAKQIYLDILKKNAVNDVNSLIECIIIIIT